MNRMKLQYKIVMHFGRITKPGGQVARPIPWSRHPPSWVGPTPPVAYFPSHSLFLSRNSSSCSVLDVLAVLEHGTLISLFSHLFELIFGTSTPWYVTPSP